MEQQQIIVRKMARALARAGLVTAFGHCSVRLDEKSFLVCAPKPMGIIKPGEAGTLGSTDAPFPQGVVGGGKMHHHIYKRPRESKAINPLISSHRVTPPA